MEECQRILHRWEEDLQHRVSKIRNGYLKFWRTALMMMITQATKFRARLSWFKISPELHRRFAMRRLQRRLEAQAHAYQLRPRNARDQHIQDLSEEEEKINNHIITMPEGCASNCAEGIRVLCRREPRSMHVLLRGEERSSLCRD